MKIAVSVDENAWPSDYTDHAASLNAEWKIWQFLDFKPTTLAQHV